jgi:hypothetical protein
MQKNDGGYAFPVPETINDGNVIRASHKGMSVRDYLAAQMMAGDAANSASDDSWANDVKDEYLLARARLYYRMADAMIKVSEE